MLSQIFIINLEYTSSGNRRNKNSVYRYTFMVAGNIAVCEKASHRGIIRQTKFGQGRETLKIRFHNQSLVSSVSWIKTNRCAQNCVDLSHKINVRKSD